MFSKNMIANPYWMHGVADQSWSGDAQLPESADIVIVGSGYTGTSAALNLAKQGKKVVVLDAGSIGFGASSRNTGVLVRTKVSQLASVAKKYGEPTAIAINEMYNEAYSSAIKLIEDDLGDCGLTKHGQLDVAHSKKAFDKFRQVFESKDFYPSENNPRLLDKVALSTEVGSDRYYGGLLHPDMASVDPGMFLRSLVDAARSAGGDFVDHCEVQKITSVGKQFELSTAKGLIKSENVILATNGHTGPLKPYLQRRVLPMTGVVIVTEELDKSMIKEILPNRRSCRDTQIGFTIFRPSTDGRRLVFAKVGTPGSYTEDIRKYIPAPYKRMIEIFPQLRGVGIEYAWPGTSGVSFDGVPHIGKVEGVHFALGLNGMGIAMGAHLGKLIAEKILGADDTLLETLPFPSPAFYRGNPWFTPAVRLAIRAADFIK